MNMANDDEVAKALECYCDWFNRLNDEAKRTRLLKKIRKDGHELWVPLTPRESQNSLLLALYDSMEKQSIPGLWDLIAELNRRSPKLQIGPRGQQSLAAFERHMTRLLARRCRG
jgi:hypothetical protein